MFGSFFGGGGGDQTIETKNDPWVGQQAYLMGLYGSAQDLPIQHPYPFPGFVPYSPATAASMEAQTGRALMGNPILPSAQMENLRTTRGDYLYGGPGFDAAFGAAQRRISPLVRGQFEGVGRYGGGLAQQAETQALGDAFAGLYGQERDRQLRASLAAPGLAQADYYDIAQLGQVGAQQEARAAQALQDSQNRWAFQQQAPYNRLAASSAAIQGGFPGGTQTQQVPTYSNPLMSALGGGMAGYALGGPAGLTGLGLSPLGGFGIGAGLGLVSSWL